MFWQNLISLVFFSAITFSHALYTGKKNWRKSPFTNINEAHRDICTEVASFTPNFCSSSAAQQYCNWLCDERKNKDYLTCGRKLVKPKQKVYSRFAENLRRIMDVNARYRRVVGGVGSQEGEWPWQVSLRINGTQWCGGSILSSRFIMTAAHCFDEYITSMKPEDWHVYAGDHELHAKDFFEQQVKVKRVFFHDEYFLYLHQHRKGSWVTADNDIAIMELAQPIDLQHEHRGQVCLPDNKQPIRDGQYCHVIGWGHTSYKGKQPDHLMHAVVMTIPNKICNLEMAYNGTVKEKYLLCAGYKEGGIDACNYDSGGAMVCHTNGRWYAQGIVSSGFECATPNAYGLYTRVSQDKEWIIETLLKSAAPKPIY